MLTEKDKKRRIPGAAGWLVGKLPLGPFGRPLCRKCGDEVPVGCRSFCSAECIHEWKIRTQPSYAAIHVLKRDAGVCALCGLDCPALLAELKALRKAVRRATLGNQADHVDYDLPMDTKPGEFVNRCEALGLPPHLRHLSRRLWDMDHTVPVVEGGGSVGLEGLRTLCWACHRNETAALRKRMAGTKAKAKRMKEAAKKRA